ncbi:LamG-like jellyroll fold domain-containing protein [Lacinutrix gracilariae]|uniref:LamG-like jellyroll fold domain-containing protein n=1 Tax=Lacinutrix gracilariae TaxID=1747198 RepID=A0ABW5K5U4_9FLAO
MNNYSANYIFSKVLLSIIFMFVFKVSFAQCNYDITNLGNNDLVAWNGFHISNVTINGDNATGINNTNNNSRYTDFTNLSVDVTAGNTYNFSINNDKGGNAWGDVQIRIWIDYNNDGNYTQVFSDYYEQDYGPTTHQVTGSFTVDTAASTGAAKLRIQAAYCSTCGGRAVLSSDGCDFTNTYRGDVEDYTLNIGNGSIAADPTYCEPDQRGDWNTYYITNVTLGEINNTTSGTGGAYQDYTANQASVIAGSTVTGSVTVRLNSNNPKERVFVWVDFNHNGTLDDAGEEFEFDVDGRNSVVVPISIDIPNGLYYGDTRMRVALVSDVRDEFSPCRADYASVEFEDYTLNIINEAATQDIAVSGNSVNIVSGTTTTSTDNFTNFNIYDINSGAVTRTFVLENTGNADLVLNSPYVSVVGEAFSVNAQPALTTLSQGQSTTFSIAFDPDVVGSYSGVVSILSNDVDENPFTFAVEGEGAQTFPDTDGDGVPDNIDVDDDNDGLTDAYESLICASYPNASTTDLVFLNETFGAGTNRIQINGNYSGATTTYCYEDGTGSCYSGNNATSVNDGDYTVYHTITDGDGVTEGIDVDIADWAEGYWYTGGDHTSGDVNGRMAIFNAAEDPGVFYRQEVTGVTTGVPIQFGFYAINIDRIDAPGIDTRNKPDVTITIYDDLGNEIASQSSGLIPATSPAGDWVEVSASFISSVSQFTVVLTNSQLGGLGNDLAIDDIFVKQTLCDLDADGVADVVDLDNDNDGIPNVVELGYIDDNLDATVYNDVNNVWVDDNGNGMHDAYEGLTALDSDGDGVPNHIDLDSDNDGVFDNVEYNGYGDIDINGDGIGNGSDYQDIVVNNTNDDQDGDGILPSIDDNDNDIDGGFDTDHGTFTYNQPIDSDGDGVPDYLDIDSNDASNDPSNGTDISETIYAYLDADNDGIIDGDTDADADGLLDAFDTDDANFGSPRDLDDSYSLFFDGRNDYVEDVNVLTNGNASIMAWIKSEGANALNTNRIVAGQNNFYLVVNDSNNAVTVMLNGRAVITSTDLVVDHIWTHIAATTNGSETILYVNGEAQGTPLSSGGINADASNFTIGRLANTDANYFHGEIDEVRVFNSSLTETEIQRTVYQELEENQSFNQGKIIPKDISENSIGANLVRYYKMDGYKDDITDNKVTPAIDQVNGAKLYNIKKIYFQTAPLPYQTVDDGDWSEEKIWLYGDVWDITDYQNNKDWSIVHIKNNVDAAHAVKNIGLLVDNDKTFTVNGDNQVNNSWYLELDGALDLKEDSQLIQGANSDLVTSANGKILRRQEGASSYYWYNYWASPVGQTGVTTLSNNNAAANNTNNTSFSVNMLKKGDGSAVQFISGNHQTDRLSTRWMYTYQNGVTYYDWGSVNQTTAINPGVGYIHKGMGVGTEQQYLFEGKPNNGTIKISVSDVGGLGSVPGVSKTEYLLGNPYASAIDIYKFLEDNASVLEGSIQLWQQWDGASHVTSEYEGGYAQVNKTGSVRAYQFEGGVGGNNGSLDGTKLPTKYLPVGQGFIAEIENSGTVVFKNSQRVFVKEADADGTEENGSVFFRSSASNEEDIMQKLRLEFNALDGQATKRELLLGFSGYTTDAYDYGYEAKNTDDNHDDLNLMLDGEYMTIQSYAEITDDKVVPLALKTSGNNSYSIKLTETINITEDQDVYLRDNLTNVYYNLRQDTAYTFTSTAGVFNDRFEIVFSNQTLSTEEVTVNNNTVIYYNNNSSLLYVKGLNNTVSNLQLINMLGQTVYAKTSVSNTALENGLPIHTLATGIYIVKLKTENNNTIDKKIVVE